MYNNENSQREILARRRDEGIDSLRQLSTRLNNVILNRGEPILDCTDVAGLEPDEMAALFDQIDRAGWNSKQINNFINRVIIQDTLDRDLDGEIREYLEQDKEKIGDNSQVPVPEDKEPIGTRDGTENDTPIKENQEHTWVAPALVCIGMLIVSGLIFLTQKTSNLPVSAIPSITTISTLEANKLTIGILGDQKKFAELKSYLQQKFGDRVRIQFDGSSKTDYQTLKDNIARQQPDIVFTLSPMISIAAKDNGYIWAAKMFPNKPPFYQSVLFVKANSPIQNLKDIQPKTIIALGDLNSASSFYMPSYTLYGKQLTVDRGHRGSKIIELVKSGQADVGAAAAEAIGDSNSEFRIIDKSRNIPGAGVYLSPKLSMQDRQILKKVLLNAPQSAIDPTKANYGAGEEPDYTQFGKITNRVESMLTCVDWSQKQISFYCPEREVGITGKVMSAVPSAINLNQAHLKVKISDRKTYPVIIPVPLINQIPGGGSLLNLKNKQIRLIDVQPSKGSDGKLKIKIDRASQIKILE
jgi:ABC-type phosphate/phosphonate transport system substrate-binding protein